MWALHVSVPKVPKGLPMSVVLPDQKTKQPSTAVINFRDLGMYSTANRVAIRRMTVFRSATLSHLEDDDIRALRHLGVKTIIDLRTPEEQELDGVVSSHVGAQLRTLPLLTSLWVPPQAADSVEYLAARYIEMFLECTSRLADIIETIVREPGPVVFHCMAGKDRTGVVAATILDLLGVADETILHDYTLSEPEMPRLRTLFEQRFPQRQIPVHANLFDTAPVRSLAQAIDYVRSERGSVQQLLRDAGMSLGTIAALRALLLEH